MSTLVTNDFSSLCNGATLIFTTTSTPNVVKFIELEYNGIGLTYANDYTVTGTTIQIYTFMPQTGDTLVCKYLEL